MAALPCAPAAKASQHCRGAAFAAPPAAVQPSGRCPTWRAQTSRSTGAATAEARSDERWLLTAQQGYVPNAVEVSKLLAQSFRSADPLDDEDGLEGAPLPRPALLQYQLKLLTALQWRATTLGQEFITITATDRSSGQLAGVANVTPGLSLADADDHLELRPGEVVAAVSNMAVAAAFRRQGLGRLLLAACERAAAECYSPPATLLALAVYRYNEAAVQLYTGSGYFVDDTWLDRRWADSAEKGQVGFARRQLMLKPLGATSMHRSGSRGTVSSSSSSVSTAL